MKFRITGAHKDTGDDIQMTIDVADQHAAEKWAFKNGIISTSITPQEPPAPPPSDPNAQINKPYVAEKDGVIWLIAAIAVLFALLISDQRIGFFDAVSLGATIGTAIGSFLLVYVFGLIGAKIGGKDPRRARTGFAIGAFVFLAMGVVGEYRMRQYRVQEVLTSAQQLNSQVHSSFTNSPTPSIDGMTAREAADAKLLLAEVQAIFAEAKKQGEEYQQRLLQITAGGIIKPSQLETAEQIAITKAKIVRLREMVDAQQKYSDEMYTAMPKRIDALGISASMKESAIESCTQSLAPARESTRKIFESDRAFFDECDHLADFMHDRLGHFHLDGTTIVFQDDTDVAEYNVIISRIQQLASNGQELREQAQQAGQQKMDAVEHFFKPN